MQKKITLELTKAEVLMLQELTEDVECDDSWKQDVIESLRGKALRAYAKPIISREEYLRRLEITREMWRGEIIEELMVRAAKREMRFLYELEEKNETA